MRFTNDDKHLIKWMRVKKYVEKHLLKMFLTEDELLIIKCKDTDQNINARSLTLLTFLQRCGHCVVNHSPNMSQ